MRIFVYPGTLLCAFCGSGLRCEPVDRKHPGRAIVECRSYKCPYYEKPYFMPAMLAELEPVPAEATV